MCLHSNIDDMNNTIIDATEHINQRDIPAKKNTRKEKALDRTNINVGEESFQQIRISIA